MSSNWDLPLIVTRHAIDLVYQTLQEKIAYELTMSSGKVYLMQPEELYVNKRTELTNNLEESRYPAISIFPEDARYNYTNNAPVIQQDSYAASGLIKVYTSDLEVRQDMIFCVETTTKKEHRRYFELMLQFFNRYNRGITLSNDTLPENSGTMNVVLYNDGIKQDTMDAPYKSIFHTFVDYRMYRETMDYLFYEYIINGKVGTNGAYSDDYDFSLTGSI